MFDLINHGSYLGIMFVLVIAGMGLPLPEEVPVIAAGVLSAHRALEPGWAFAACLVGAIAGDCIMYFLGYHFGRGVLLEHPRLSGFLTPERERRVERMILRHGVKAMLLARFIVGIRSSIYLTAGIMRVPFRWFLLVDAACATLVVGAFFWLSYRFGDKITAWVRGSQYGITAIVVIAMAAVISGYFLHRRRPRLEAALEDDPEGVPSEAPSVAQPRAARRS